MNADSSSQYMGTQTTPTSHQSSSSNQRNSLQKSGGSISCGSGSTSGNGSGTNNRCNTNAQECPLCYCSETSQGFFTMLNCKHFACRSCLESYLTIEIFESRTEIACPQCADAMHPSDIETLLRSFPTVMKKYEDFMVRRVLLSDPDSRWCPAPDCRYIIN